MQKINVPLPAFVAGRHINTLLRTHVQEITSHSRTVIFLLLTNVQELKQTKQ